MSQKAQIRKKPEVSKKEDEEKTMEQLREIVKRVENTEGKLMDLLDSVNNDKNQTIINVKKNRLTKKIDELEKKIDENANQLEEGDISGDVKDSIEKTLVNTFSENIRLKEEINKLKEMIHDRNQLIMNLNSDIQAKDELIKSQGERLKILERNSTLKDREYAELGSKGLDAREDVRNQFSIDEKKNEGKPRGPEVYKANQQKKEIYDFWSENEPNQEADFWQNKAKGKGNQPKSVVDNPGSLWIKQTEEKYKNELL
eukprot:TRINITY_DN2894_c0_g2_i8.p1 TRINITY_DN2894_c0_g2~~TRINITY_DN2894_c0_g2_i8.p1  ORF type:complete len:257 (+),score=77.97 TRINITY_DN2894_c0_g2_i8:366-1136(+)